MNFFLLLPEFVLVGVAFVVLGLDLFLPREQKHHLAYYSAAGILVTAASSLLLWGVNDSLYGGLFVVDGYALFFALFFLAVAFVVTLASVEYVRKNLLYPGEYYGLILLSTLAMMFMAASRELITAYISLELLSFSFYVLVSYAKFDARSNEAGIKYVILGAFSSALLLYGLAMIYGLTRTTYFNEIARVIQSGVPLQPALLVGLALVIAGLGFKVAAVPFHMWTPDVYQGAPLPITAFISVASKAAGFALLLRLFAEAFLPAINDWQTIIVVLSAISMTVGNLVAIQQRNIKRMLAYSSIGQAGYILMGVAVLSPMAVSGILFHLAGYAFSNLAAFCCVIAYHNLSGKEDIPDYAGLAERAPFVALVMSVALFSLAGLPFFAGFATKFYLFTAVAKGGYLWLVGLAVTTSLISLYYYLMVVKQMYIGVPSEAVRFRLSQPLVGVLGLLLLGVIGLGVYPAPLLKVIESASTVILPLLPLG